MARDNISLEVLSERIENLSRRLDDFSQAAQEKYVGHDAVLKSIGETNTRHRIEIERLNLSLTWRAAAASMVPAAMTVIYLWLRGVI